jgi:uncharacterized Zn finger protein
MEAENIICHLCGIPLQNVRVELTYMGHIFHTDLPKCPQCGQVFVPEDLVKGKMADVETELEDK